MNQFVLNKNKNTNLMYFFTFLNQIMKRLLHNIKVESLELHIEPSIKIYLGT